MKGHLVFFRFILSSLLAAGLDAALFMVVYRVAHNIMLGLVIGRVLIGSLNFMINKRLVFYSNGEVKIEITKIIFLAAFLMLLSYILINTLLAHVKWDHNA